MEDFIVAEYFEEFPNFLMAFRLTKDTNVSVLLSPTTLPYYNLSF